MSQPFRLPRLRLPLGRRADAAAERPAADLGNIAPSEELQATRWNQTFRALRHRNYRLFYAGQSISLSGTWMQMIGQAWLVLQLTDSKAALGTVTMLQFLPITFLVLFGGVIADRVPKRNFILMLQTVAMLQALILAALVWSGQVELWHVYVLAVVLGLANAFDTPTRQSFVMEMVGKDDLMNAIALNSGMFNGARLIGPAIGGVVIAVIGVKGAFLINGLSFLPVIAGLMMMDLSQLYTENRRPAGPAKPLAELREGISYALKTPATLLIVILAAFIGMFGFNFIVVLPLVARYVLDGGSVELGFLWAAIGLGALISALVLAGRNSATKFTMFTGGIAFAALLGAVALSQWFYLTLLLLLAVGVANTAFSATANTSLQLATPDRLRGRVMGLWMLLFAGSTPIGSILTAFMADRIGVPAAIGVNAALCGLGVSAGLAYYLSHRQEVARTSDAGASVSQRI